MVCELFEILRSVFIDEERHYENRTFDFQVFGRVRVNRTVQEEMVVRFCCLDFVVGGLDSRGGRGRRDDTRLHVMVASTHSDTTVLSSDLVTASLLRRSTLVRLPQYFVSIHSNLVLIESPRTSQVFLSQSGGQLPECPVLTRWRPDWIDELSITVLRDQVKLL